MRTTIVKIISRIKKLSRDAKISAGMILLSLFVYILLITLFVGITLTSVTFMIVIGSWNVIVAVEIIRIDERFPD